MAIEFANRLSLLPPYIFQEIDRMRDEVKARGVDIIDLGVGDPDKPTPGHIIDALCEAAHNPATHKYPAYSGMSHFRETAAAFMQRRFGLDLHPTKEVITLIGSKEGIAHFPFAFVNPGDVVLVPSPAYPVYYASTLLAGGTPVIMPLLAENGFLPDLDAIEPEALEKAKALVVNYPNNPTAAMADLDFYAKLVEFAKKHDLILVSDAAYSEMAYDGVEPPSILQVDGAKDVAIEFHSLSKTYNMTGWRIGWACGNAKLIAGMGKIKSQIDSGAFDAVQLAGIAALEGDQSCVKEMKALYEGRRDVLCKGLDELGYSANMPHATFYVWCKTAEGYSSSDMTMKLLNEAGVLTTPGSGFGQPGEGYIRFALTVDEGRLQEALGRLADVKF